jgi:hypothetical protein
MARSNWWTYYLANCGIVRIPPPNPSIRKPLGIRNRRPTEPRTLIERGIADSYDHAPDALYQGYPVYGEQATRIVNACLQRRHGNR